MTDIVDSIICGCMYSDDYMRQVIPHIKTKYFEEEESKIIYEALIAHVEKYNQRPSKEALSIAINKLDDISNDVYQGAIDKLTAYEGEKNKDIEEKWLVDETEEWCKNRDLFLAIQRSVLIIRGEDKELSVNALPGLLQDALAISFDSSIGHDFIEDAESRFEFYHEDLERVGFDIEILNKITKGGTPNKTFNMLMGGTGSFKSGCMCHMAAANLADGKNVLYITLELSEERVAERIDANLLNCDLDDLKNMDRDLYLRKIRKIKENSVGRLIIKEYPTASANVGHFRHLLRELLLKKDFKADIIYVDYVNICASARCKGSENAYTVVKAIAEELRGLAVEFDLPIWSATQTNRDGLNADDVSLTNVSDSIGIAYTADLILALISTPELVEQGLMMMKQLKNRYGPIDKHEKFVVGIDKSKMQLFDSDDANNNDGLGSTRNKSESQREVMESACEMPSFGKKSHETDVEFQGFNFS